MCSVCVVCVYTCNVCVVYVVRVYTCSVCVVCVYLATRMLQTLLFNLAMIISSRLFTEDNMSMRATLYIKIWDLDWKREWEMRKSG